MFAVSNETALGLPTILNWVIPSIVTIVAVLLAQWAKNFYDRREEDRHRIFGPLNLEVTGIPQLGSHEPSGFRAWIPTPGFWDIDQRRILHQKRYRDLRLDVAQLKRLGAAYNTTWEEFRNLLGGSLHAAWNTYKITIKDNQGNPKTVVLSNLIGAYAPEPFNSLVAGDLNGGIEHLKDMIALAASPTGQIGVGPEAKQICEHVDNMVSPTRRKYQ